MQIDVETILLLHLSINEFRDAHDAAARFEDEENWNITVPTKLLLAQSHPVQICCRL